MNYVTYSAAHAAKELDLLSALATDPENRPIIEPFRDEILALAEKFGLSGQSGGSAPYTASALSGAIKALLMFKTLSPITGEDWEWTEVEDGLYQNLRCSALFKHEAGVYYLDAITWIDSKGHGWSGSAFLDKDKRTIVRSRQYIKEFPFTPKTFEVPVDEVEGPKDNWDFFVKDHRDLLPVFEYYESL